MSDIKIKLSSICVGAVIAVIGIAIGESVIKMSNSHNTYIGDGQYYYCKPNRIYGSTCYRHHGDSLGDAYAFAQVSSESTWKAEMLKNKPSLLEGKPTFQE